MNPTKEQAFEKINSLVERFREHVEEYKRGIYNEHQTRVDYINPFFKALGWDMDNEQGLAEAYREVIHEDKVKVGGATKAPDYAFTLFGQRKFFVDAKKPGINIKADIGPAYQVRRYGWSAKVPISVVTDFEEFAIYDCTKKPNPGDKSSVSRIKYLTFEQYLEEFDFLWDIFAKENLPRGRFDKYVQSDTGRKGTTTVDEEFLKSIEQWRTYLATSIALRNKSLSVDELNFAVQKTIDRIIFLRMCEDRGVETYGLLRKAAEKGDVYRNLFELFQTADEKYNSGLFDLNEDRITRELVIDNKVLKTIIGELYYPKCEYEFSVMPADILGSVYERFLGKTIRLTAGHQAKVEEKPEVRKAGGVYYTPKYIVDYIVENTVGKLLKGKEPKDVEKLRICDPACGSGSFLIGAYQYLLDWHLRYYAGRGEEGKRSISKFLTPDGNLTTAEKKKILLNNIYGVDIDPQAVEVTKLNLLLKALEGETQASINQQMTLFHERVLPNLSHNIQCGNSLIGPDFYDNQFDLFPDQMKKINAFDWQRAFPEVFGEGGFSCVIGNPPYGFMIPTEQQKYFELKFKNQDYQKDLYLLFLERYEHFLMDFGLLGIIISNTWLQSVTLKKIRSYLVNNYTWKKVLQIPEKVFKAVVDTHVIIFVKQKPGNENRIEVETLKSNIIYPSHHIVQSDLPSDGQPINISVNKSVRQLFEKINSNNPKLSELCSVYNGVKPFEKGKGNPPQTEKIITEKPFVKEGIKPGENWTPLIRGSLINRYRILWNDNYWIDYGPWLAAPRNPNIFKHEEMIFVRQTGDTLIGAYSEKGFIARDNIHIIIPKYVNIKYLLGLINSRLLDFIYSYINPEKGEALAQVKKGHIEILPIKVILASNQNEIQIQNEIINLVNTLIKLYEEMKAAKLTTQVNLIQSRIYYCEERINLLVIQLYGLTEEEVVIIEGNSSTHGRMDASTH